MQLIFFKIKNIKILFLQRQNQQNICSSKILFKMSLLCYIFFCVAASVVIITISSVVSATEEIQFKPGCDVGGVRICYFPMAKVEIIVEDYIVMPFVKSNQYKYEDNSLVRLSWWATMKREYLNEAEFASTLAKAQSRQTANRTIILFDAPNHVAHFTEAIGKIFAIFRMLSPKQRSFVTLINAHPEVSEWRSAWNQGMLDVVSKTWGDFSYCTRKCLNGDTLLNVFFIQGSLAIQRQGITSYSVYYFAESNDADAFRSKMLSLHGVSKTEADLAKSICIARRTETRAILNFYDLHSRLTQLAQAHNISVEVLTNPISLSPKEASVTMSKCRHFIYVHGAEGMLMLLMPAGSYPIEIFPSRFMINSFYYLASQLSHQYMFVYPKTERCRNHTTETFYGCVMATVASVKEEECNLKWSKENIAVDVDEIVAAVKAQLVDMSLFNL